MQSGLWQNAFLNKLLINMRQSLDPRIINARFDSFCHETREPIRKGDSVLYYPLERKVYKLTSNTAAEYFKWQQDIDLGHNY